jgi:hypothetical protein
VSVKPVRVTSPRSIFEKTWKTTPPSFGPIGVRVTGRPIAVTGQASLGKKKDKS